MIIYIDISYYVKSRANTGIQRVVKEFLFRLLAKGHQLNTELFCYDVDLNKFILLNKKEVISFLNDTKEFNFKQKNNCLQINEIQKEDIFFDIDGVWNNDLKRINLYRKLKENEVKIFNFIYDLVPIVKPQFAHKNTVRNFLTFLYSVYQYSDMVFFDSRSAENDFINIKEEINNKRLISTRVIKLGADMSSSFLSENKCRYKNLLEKKYILFVGTLEPRKNQGLVVDVFEKLSQKYDDLNLVLIGKAGWNNDRIVNRLRKHSLREKKLFWLDDINDDELKLFYKNAFITTYISEYEGFGLPVMESLSYGNITITSKNSSIYEVGKDYADYLIYNSFNELYETIECYLYNNEFYQKKKGFIKKEFIPYSWDSMYSSLVDIFNNYNKKNEITKPTTLQFVFISIDIENLKGTIEAIDKYIDFVSEYIIITRADMIENFTKIASKYKIKVIDENQILGEYTKDFSKRDHQSKNWLLRASLLKLECLNEQFIMLDDDNRPIRNISIDHFVKDGKYNAYYFYDLLNWHNYNSEYDFGQHLTQKVLDKNAYELLSYSSHKPQIIDKNIFQEVINKYFNIGLSKPIDEWSSYFNYAISRYPFLFTKKRFDVLNWPGRISSWNFQYTPTMYNFENFYSQIYKDGLFRNQKNISHDKKIELKYKEILPYEKTKKYNTELSLYCKNENIVHGVLQFTQHKKSFYFYSLPYYLEAEHGSWIKVPLNYKAINLKGTKTIQIMYYINGRKGHVTNVYINDSNYYESVVHFAISATSLPVGLYELIVDVLVNGRSVYGKKSPYMSKLLVKKTIKGK